MAKQNYAGVYANMEFPTYTYQEYPKHVPTGPHGQYEIATSAHDEENILAKLQKDHDDAPAEFVHATLDPAKEILISRAYELEVPINRKWSIAKLQAVVSAAEADVDNLPADGVEFVAPVAAKVESAAKDETPFGDDEDKDALIEEAKELGINANKLWGIPRLKSAIAEAKQE